MYKAFFYCELHRISPELSRCEQAQTRMPVVDEAREQTMEDSDEL
jgi:hypothetical protein